MQIKLKFRYYILNADIPLPSLVSILRPNVLQSATCSVMLINTCKNTLYFMLYIFIEHPIAQSLRKAVFQENICWPLSSNQYKFSLYCIVWLTFFSRKVISYSIALFPHFIFKLGVFSAWLLVSIIKIFTSVYKVWSLCKKFMQFTQYM